MKKAFTLFITSISISFASLIFIISLFQGCSGHTLQDLIDGDKTKDTLSTTEASDKKEPKVVAPSQNKALHSISPSTTASDAHEEHRYIQNSTNRWMEEEWEPLTESNTSTNKERVTVEDTSTDINSSSAKTLKSSDDINSTGLQYYVDKAGLYMENKKRRDANKTEVPSHVEKVNAMPGIGKPKSRH